MIFDFYNGVSFPRDQGAVDMKDSARLAGLMTLFEHPQMPYCEEYVVNGYPTRHPQYAGTNDKSSMMSRDQAVCLAAGLWSQIGVVLPGNYKPENGDWISPSQRGHFKRCADERPSLLSKLWLYLDVYYSAYVDPMAEPNQLISMLVVAGPEWVRLWCRLNKKWASAIMVYWASWRGEEDFALFMIEKIKEMIK